jgi:AcrR family transcriptional regulator
MYIQLEHDGTSDPRVLRTRQLLINSFADLIVKRKSIRAISVQSITAQAGVNRVTFYAHFTDKYELLDVWMRVLFRQSVREKLSTDAPLDHANLELLASAVLEFFVMRFQYRKRINEQFEPMIETAIQQELKAMLTSMLENTSAPATVVSMENVASFLSWSIFGSALDWSRAHERQSKEMMTLQLVTLCEAVINAKHT